MWLIEFSDKLRIDTHYIFQVFSLSTSCTKRRACEDCKIFKRVLNIENYKIAQTWLLKQSLQLVISRQLFVLMSGLQNLILKSEIS